MTPDTTLGLYTHVCMHTHIHTPVHMHVPINAKIHTRIYTHKPARTHVPVHAKIHTHTYGKGFLLLCVLEPWGSSLCFCVCICSCVWLYSLVSNVWRTNAWSL